MHCNALQHTATHCDALQRTTPHYTALQHTNVTRTAIYITLDQESRLATSVELRLLPTRRRPACLTASRAAGSSPARLSPHRPPSPPRPPSVNTTPSPSSAQPNNKFVAIFSWRDLPSSRDPRTSRLDQIIFWQSLARDLPQRWLWWRDWQRSPACWCFMEKGQRVLR